MDGDYGIGHFGGGFIGIIFWVILIAVIIFAVRWLSDSRATGGDNSTESALDILNKRYARGEIDQNEYERKKREISNR